MYCHYITAYREEKMDWKMDWYDYTELRKMGIKCSPSSMVSKKANFVGNCKDRIEIGYNTRIDAGVMLMAGSKDAYLSIGNHIHIAANAILMAAGGIELCDFTCVGINSQIISASDDFSGDYLIGPMVSSVLTHNGKPGETYGNVKRAKVTLEPHAIITTACTVLPGVTMRQGAVLGAMSLATKDLEEWAIHAGIPARKIRQRTRWALELGAEFDREYNPF